jgi:hypothetical protein
MSKPHGLRGIKKVESGKWQARLFSNGRSKNLGRFATKEEAAEPVALEPGTGGELRLLPIAHRCRACLLPVRVAFLCIRRVGVPFVLLLRLRWS